MSHSCISHVNNIDGVEKIFKSTKCHEIWY